ncbi:probable splicing factor, arginine/serine-rich 7 isoform X11 [Hydra vulgaris]|uniref:Probable splicing factor, arginine/serine-rich 7 isoform X11 n=1 Tax=Hydra vulgaris TaxID=6087 RepID=A0ABM4C827_HYDVU
MKQKMKEESRKIEESSFTGKVVQITNVSPGATLQQMATLFGFLGTVTDIRLYPSDDDIKVAVKLCYIQYDNSEQCGIAQHLTNTVFIDKALIVVPINRTEVPEENECVSLLKSINAYAGMSTAVLMNHITPSDNEIPPLPPIPVVTTTTDPVEIDEIRRTVFVQNIPPDITADQLMAFFSGVGEVKYLRLCKGDSGKYAFVEFTAIDSVPTALQYNGVLFGGRCLKVDYSKHPIIKPESEQIAIGRSSTRKSRESVLNPTINCRRSRSRTPRSRSRTRRSRSRSIKRSPRRKSLTRSPIRKRSISRSPRRRRSITRSPRRRRSPSRFSNIGLRGLNRESRKDTELVKTIDRRRRSRRSISRSRSPRRKSRSISPRRRSKSRSPIKRSISKSPIRKSKSESPRTKSKSKSPKRSKSRSPRRKSKSKSPKRRSRSRSIRKRTRSKSPKRRSRTRSPRKKSRRRSRSKSPRKKSKKSISRSPERSSVKKKKKDKSKEVEKSTEELQSLLTKIYTFEEEREKEKKSKEKNRESSDESTKSKKKKKKSSSRE